MQTLSRSFPSSSHFYNEYVAGITDDVATHRMDARRDITEAEVREAHVAYVEGKTGWQVAQMLGIYSVNSVYRLFLKYNLPREKRRKKKGE